MLSLNLTVPVINQTGCAIGTYYPVSVEPYCLADRWDVSSIYVEGRMAHNRRLCELTGEEFALVRSWLLQVSYKDFAEAAEAQKDLPSVTR